MAEPVKSYDAYISVSDDDDDLQWLETVLKPYLKERRIESIANTELPSGGFEVEEIAKAIAASRYSLFVLTPAWNESGRGRFEQALALVGDMRGTKHGIIPLWLKDSPIPPTLKIYTKRDFRSAPKSLLQLRLLSGTLRPAPKTVREIPITLTERTLTAVWDHPLRAIVFLVIFGLLLSAFVKVPSFRGWVALPPIQDPVTLQNAVRVRDAILISTAAEKPSCDRNINPDTGLYRKLDGESSWVAIDPDNCYTANKVEYRGTLWQFAETPAEPDWVFAASQDGVLLSEDFGLNWHHVGETTLPISATYSIAVAPTDAKFILVGGQNEGLYRTTNGGASWDQLDVTGRCTSQSGASLPPHLRWHTLLVNQTGIFAGTNETPVVEPSSDAGLYFSRDGGNCWSKLHDGAKRFSYMSLVTNPISPDQVLALVFDYQVAPRRADQPRTQVETYFMWAFGPNLQAPRRSMFKSYWQVRSIYLTRGANPKWYIADKVGRVFSGTPSQFEQTNESLPAIGNCHFECANALPPALFDNANGAEPMVLGDRTVFRWDYVSWWDWLLEQNALRGRMF